MGNDACRRSFVRLGGITTVGIVAGCLRLETVEDDGEREGGSATQAQASGQEIDGQFYELLDESQEHYADGVQQGIDVMYEAVETGEWEAGEARFEFVGERLTAASELAREADPVAGRDPDEEYVDAATAWTVHWQELLEDHLLVGELLREICRLGEERTTIVEDRTADSGPEELDRELDSHLERIEQTYAEIEEHAANLQPAIERTVAASETIDDWELPEVHVRRPPNVDFEERDDPGTGLDEFWEAIERSQEHYTVASQFTDRAADAHDAEEWRACEDALVDAREELGAARETAMIAGEAAEEADSNPHVSAVEMAMELYGHKNERIRQKRHLCVAGENDEEDEIERLRESLEELAVEIERLERDLDRTLDEL